MLGFVCDLLPAVLQDCILSADPDEVLPDVNSLLLTVNREGLSELREQQEKRRAAQAAGPPAAAGARQQPAVGLLLCSREWVGLELQHTGSWQLSLVYTDEHLKFFGQVSCAACPGPVSDAALPKLASFKLAWPSQKDMHSLWHCKLRKSTQACCKDCAALPA